MSRTETARSVEEIDRLIGEWEALRADYERRGSTGIVDFITAEIRKLKSERAATIEAAVPLKPQG